MPDFRDRFTAREVCEGKLSQINVKFAPLPNSNNKLPTFRLETQEFWSAKLKCEVRFWHLCPQCSHAVEVSSQWAPALALRSGTTNSVALVHWLRIGVQTERLLLFSLWWTRQLAISEHKACKPGVPHPAKRRACARNGHPAQGDCYLTDYLFNPFANQKSRPLLQT